MSGRTVLMAVLAVVSAGKAWSQEKCRACHPDEVQRFAQSAMGRSLHVPDGEPAGEVVHRPSGSRLLVAREGATMRHSIEAHGLSANYPVDYAIGAGQVGRSYLVNLGGVLVQSPLAFYTKNKEWGLSPGYEQSRSLDFTRLVSSDCLFCHAGSVRQTTQLEPITCERCHGSSERHRERPIPGSIVNPAKLARDERDSVCEQCHLEGAATVLNPMKSWWDFRPGERLEEVESSYVHGGASVDPTSIQAVSQAEELRDSLCVRKSGGKLWCGSCHDPHGAPVADRKETVAAVCAGCHSRQEIAAKHQPDQADCVGCHMPKRNASDVVHAAITDHRIQARPLQIAGQMRLQEWRPSLAPYGQRAWGLALFQTARREGGKGKFKEAYAELSALSDAGRDAEVEGALGYVLLASGDAARAVPHLIRSAESEPEKAERWLDVGVAEQAAGDLARAETSFRKSVAREPLDYRAYAALAWLYRSEKRESLAQDILHEYLKLNPQSITVRLLLRP